MQAKFVNGVWQARLVWSEWDKEKKKPVKKERYLGVIKETGFVPRHRKYTRRKKEEKQEQKQEGMDSVKIEVRLAGWENEPSYVWGADRIGREALKGVWAQIERLGIEFNLGCVGCEHVPVLEPVVESARGECHVATANNQ